MKFKSLLILPLLAVSLQAASVNDLTFTLINGGTEYSITGCLETAYGELNIPSSYIGKPITQIGEYAFQSCTDLTSIIIPDSVTTIGNYAFHNCTNLINITISNSVTSIGDWIFWNCTNLNSITIPDGVTSIGNNTFQSCTSLTSITVPNSVTSIGDGAFRYCNSLASVTFGGDAPTFGTNVFLGSDSVTIYYDSSNSGWTSTVAGRPAVQTNTLTFALNGDGTEYSVSDCLRTVSGSLEIPNTYNGLPVTSIGDYAFNNCSGLSNITIPEGVTSIGVEAFYNCYNITSIIIPEGVTYLGEEAFSICTSLTSIIIPESVTFIGDYAFNNCESLASITFEGEAPTLAGSQTFFRTAVNLVIYYYGANSAGFTSPTWQGVQTEMLIQDTDGDGLPDSIETNTGVFVSITDTGTDPNKPDSLYTPSEMTAARTESRTLGQQDVISSPSDYNLMGAEGVFDMRVSQPGISMNGDKASMNFTIQSSNNLQEWNNEETIQREYSMPSDKNFMRVSVGPEIEPEPETLPAIATDTYGDKLVYDESNNLYVNDENTPLMKDGVNLRTDTYAGWNFYAIESTDNGYICILKSNTQIYDYTFDSDGSYISGRAVDNLSAYESLLGQSLN